MVQRAGRETPALAASGKFLEIVFFAKKEEKNSLQNRIYCRTNQSETGK